MPAENILAQDAPTLTPEPTPSAFYLEPTATFAPDLAVLQDTVTARLSSTTFSPMTGIAFDMVLTVEIPPGQKLYEWVDFGQRWGEFEIITLSEVESERRADGGMIYRQEITAKLWTPGDKQIPDAFIGYGARETEILRVPVRKEFFSVPTVVDFNDQNLKPMRPPVYLPYIPPLLIVVSAGLAGAVGYFGRRWWQNRPQRVEVVVEQTPHERAQQSLTNVPQDADVPGVYSLVAATLREYITAKFEDVPATELTTAELLQALAIHLPANMVDDLAKVLKEADLVKFAAKSANPEIMSRVIDFAQRWIANVERVLDTEQESA